MAETNTVKIDTLENNFDKIIGIVGEQSFVDWDNFTKNSHDTVKAIDQIGRTISIFREAQHKNFIQTMKKLKGLDLPDLIKAIKSKKLPRQALRGVLNRFKLNGQELELTEDSATLKANALKQLEAYIHKNEQYIKQINTLAVYLKQQIAKTGIKIQEKQQIVQTTNKFNFSQERIQSLASDIQIQYLPNTHQQIGFKTYAQIVEKSFDLIKNDYEKMTIEARKNQRLPNKSPKQYLGCLKDYINDCEQILVQGQKALATKLGVKNLNESEIALFERGFDQSLMMVQTQLRARIKESLTPTKDVSVDTTKQLVQYQTKMLQQRSDYIKQVLMSQELDQESAQLIPLLLSLILSDMIYEKFGYEQEDFMKNINQTNLTTNKQLVASFKKMQLGIIKLMEKIGLIPPDMSKYLQEAASNPMAGGMGMMPGMMPGGPMGGPMGGGMMPGNVNPMQLLQMQQMQQMFAQQQPFQEKK